MGRGTMSEWMSAKVGRCPPQTQTDRRFCDRVDYSLTELDGAEDAYIPNFTFRTAGLITPHRR